MKTNLNLLLFNFCTLTVGFAQDSHFSQFDAIPFYINPALSGERLTDYKGIQFNASYRDQLSKYSKTSSSFKISGRCTSSSMVTDTATSDVVIMSMLVRCFSNTSKTLRKNP